MASTNGIIFPESMADILANPVGIFFGSMPAISTAPAAYLVIKATRSPPINRSKQIYRRKPTHPLLAT
jgi:hypothetical protein